MEYIITNNEMKYIVKVIKSQVNTNFIGKTTKRF